MSPNPRLRLACVLALTLGARGLPPAAAQSTELSVAPWSGVGLDGALEALGHEVTGTPVLTGAELTYGHVLFAGVSAGVGVGGMYVHRGGTVAGERFTAEAWRLYLAPELSYRLAGGWRVRAGVEVRTSADLAAFDARYADNVRPHLRLGGDYRLGERLAVTAALSRLLGDPAAIANLVDPGRSLRLGVRYRLTGPQPDPS